MPPETAVVPPITGAFSIMSVRSPLAAAVIAAVSPPPPLPTTTVSYSSTSRLIACRSFDVGLLEEGVAGVGCGAQQDHVVAARAGPDVGAADPFRRRDERAGVVNARV